MSTTEPTQADPLVWPPGWPLRARLEQMTPAELAIRNAILAVEQMPADAGLTEAVTLLMRAQSAVADFVDRAREPSPAAEGARSE